MTLVWNYLYNLLMEIHRVFDFLNISDTLEQNRYHLDTTFQHLVSILDTWYL